MATAAAPWDQDEIVVTQGNPWDEDPVMEPGAGNPWDADPVATVEGASIEQAPIETAGNAFTRGLGDIVPNIVGGGAKLLDSATDVVAKWTGTQKGGAFTQVADFTDEISAENAALRPVSDANPISAAFGGGLAQGMGLFAGGVAAKGLGLANAATVPVAAGFAMGAGSGIDQAKALGIESPEAQLAMGALFGGVEMATEKLGGLGNKAATDALMNAYKQPAEELLKRAAKTMAGEGGEEMLAGTAQDLISRAFAMEDPANPGFTKTGVKLPAMDRQFLKDRGLDFVGGAAGGVAFAGADAVMNRNRPTGPEPMASELNPVEVNPNPFSGPIEAPPQPVEGGGVVPRSPYAPPEAPPQPDTVEGGLPSSMTPSTSAEAARFEAELNRVQDEGILSDVIAEERDRARAREEAAGAEARRVAAQNLQPWDNDPKVEDATPAALPQDTGNDLPAADAAGAGAEVVLEPGQAQVGEDADGAVTIEIPQGNAAGGWQTRNANLGEAFKVESRKAAEALQGVEARRAEIEDVLPPGWSTIELTNEPAYDRYRWKALKDENGNDVAWPLSEDEVLDRAWNEFGAEQRPDARNDAKWQKLKEAASQAVAKRQQASQAWDQIGEMPGMAEIVARQTQERQEAEKRAMAGRKGAATRAKRKSTPAGEQVEALSDKFAMPAMRGPLTTLHYGQLPPSAVAAGQVWSGKIRTLHGIRQKLLEAAGLPQVGVGRFARALGIYKVKPETIRLQAINDIPVLSHELGHAIHYRELSADRTKADDWGGRFDAELLPLGAVTSTPTYTPDQVRKEGVAEFTRLWLTDPALARSQAPTFAGFWEAELTRKNPKLAAGLRAAREEIADYIAMPAMMKAKAQIVFDPTAEKTPRTLKQRLKDTYAKWVNTLQPALDVVRETAIVDPNQAVRAREVEAWMENHRGGWASKAHGDIFGNQTSLDGRRIGQGMAQILKEIGPGQAENFSTYLALKRAAEIERSGKRSGFENARLPAAEMKILEGRFEATRQKLLKWSDNELQLLVDSGLLDGQSAAKMRSANRDYVPFYRLYEKLNGMSFGPEASKNSGGYVDLNSGIRRLKGSDRAIVDPLQSLMKNAYMFRKIAEQNHIGVQFFDLLSEVQGHGKWSEQVRPKMGMKQIGHAQVVQKLIDEGVIQDESDLPPDADLTLRLYEAIKRPDTASGEVIVFKNGQRKHWEVKDPQLMEALKNSDGDSIKLWKFLGGTLGKALTLPTRIVRFGATGGPWFAIPNFIRDQVTAGVQSRTGFIPFVDGVKGAFEVMRKGDMYQRWMEAGGKFHGVTTGTQAFTDLLEDALPKEASAKRAMQALASPRNWKNALAKAGEIMEEATRVQEFARGVRQGRSDMEAANLSKAVSLNFARAGERGRAVNQLIAFTNAKIQDLDLIVRSHFDPARRGQVMAKGFLYITVPSILTWWLGKDDEEIQNLPEWRKNLFWNINLAPVSRALGRESFILSIPKPFLMGAIYGTSVERGLDYATGRDPNGARKAMKNLFAQGPDGLNPVEMVMSVAGFKPLIEATTNYNLFQDRPVVPENMKFLPKPQQYDIHTSETAKMVGQFTGQSPMVIDHLIRGYFATAGKFGTDAIDMGMAKLGAADVPPAPTKDLMEFPILNRFSGSPYAANAFVDRFYKAARDMEGKMAVFNKQTDQMTSDDQKRWWAANGRELMHYQRTVDYQTGRTGAGDVRQVMEVMGEMNKAMKEVQASRVLSPDEKRQRLMRLSLMRNEAAERGFKTLFPEPVRKRHY